MPHRRIYTLGVASGLGGLTHPCTAPHVVKHSRHNQLLQQAAIELEWQAILSPKPTTKLQAIADLNQRLALHVSQTLETGKPLLIIGGDHSCAMGSWAGVLNSLCQQQSLGLLWLDAHMDAHSFSTSPSGNLHGMPVAALLGYGDEQLQQFYPSQYHLPGHQLCLAGIRDYERDEQQLLQQAGATIAYQPTGAGRIKLPALLKALEQRCDTIGISLDMDCLHPEDAPGVDTPANDGIRANDLLNALSTYRFSKPLLAVEICEFTPQKDSQEKTEQLIFKIIRSLFAQ